MILRLFSPFLLFLFLFLFIAIIDSVQVHQEYEASARFAETDANLPSLSKIVSQVSSKLSKPRFNGASSAVTQEDEACVMCQFYVQRLQSAMIQYALRFQNEDATTATTAGGTVQAFVEVETVIKKKEKPVHVSTSTSTTETTQQLVNLGEDQSSKHDMKTDWFLSFQKAKNTLADAFNDDEAEKPPSSSSSSPLLTDETFTAPIQRQKSTLPSSPSSSQEREERLPLVVETQTEPLQSEQQQEQWQEEGPDRDREQIQEQHYQGEQREYERQIQRSVVRERLSAELNNARRYPQEVRFVAGPSALFTKKTTEAPKTGTVGVSASRRQRVVEARMSTPVSMRFQSPGGEFVEMETTLFEDFLAVCGGQPIAYGKYCDNILEQFPFIVQALDSRDTPQRICLNFDFCSQNSYAVGAPHALEQMRAEDVKKK